MYKEFMIRATEKTKAQPHYKKYGKNGVLIPMIYALREATGQGLHEAKKNVEELLRGGVIVIRTTDDQYADCNCRLHTARVDISCYPDYFIIDEDFTAETTRDFTINITAKEKGMILTALGTRKTWLYRSAADPHNPKGTENALTKDHQDLICKIIAQTKE